MSKNYYVYIMSNHSRRLYIGMTNDLARRVYEHKNKLVAGFSSKYELTRLVYYEVFNSPLEAIAREKQLKGWTRAKKIALIEESNPIWEDLGCN